MTSLLAMLAVFAASPPASPTPIPIPLVYKPPSWGEQHLAILYGIQGLFFVSAAGLIALMSVQTTKNEGLSGSVGGRVESAYRGRLGLDEQLKRLTGIFAVAFIVLSIVYFFITR